MKKLFASWLLDIAKYLITVLLLSTALTDIGSGWFFYAATFALVAFIVLLGVILYLSGDKDDKNKNKNKGKDKNKDEDNT